MKVLFIGKKADLNTENASESLKRIFPDSKIIFGSKNEPFPANLSLWEGNYIFSYLSPWIIPQSLLQRAKDGAINWHPGPPEYPGIGCTNFAIYNKEKTFGITCHHMLAKVDTGDLIEIHRFPILENESVCSITQKCYSLILKSFNGIVKKISDGESLPRSDEKWTRRPYTRKELDALSEIKPDMTIEEIEKRIKATTYDKPWAFVSIKGKKFYFK